MNQPIVPSENLQSANVFVSQEPFLSYHLSACGRNEGHHCNSRLDIPETHHMASSVVQTVNGPVGQVVVAACAVQASCPSHSPMHACTSTTNHTHTPIKVAPQGILDGSFKKYVYEEKQT